MAFIRIIVFVLFLVFSLYVKSLPSKTGIEQLKRDEGFTPVTSYLQSQSGLRENVRTIGYGYNIDAAEHPEFDLILCGVDEEHVQDVLMGNRRISKQQAESLFLLSVLRAYNDATRVVPGFTGLDPPIQDILVNLAYQVGARGLKRFGRMLAALDDGDYERMADEILKSELANRQASNRAKRLADRVREYGKRRIN